MSQGQRTDGAPTRDGETEDMLPVRGVQSPPTLHRVSRRPLGIGPVPLLGGGVLATLLLAIALIAIGAWPVGIVLLVGGVMGAALFLVAVEQQPEDPAARAAVSAAERARSQTRLIGVAARAWSRAALAMIRLRRRRYRLRWRFRRQLQPLGEAAYRGEEDQVQRLRAEARRMEEALRQAELETAAAIEAARADIDRERAPRAATRSLPVQDPPEDVPG